MAFSKTIFVDNQTVIDADTLNAIQDELIRVAGLLGKDIQSAAIDNSGHLILTLTDGTTLDAGVAKGSDGVTPHIGDNGNWYLGSTDTGKPSRGATGAQGPKGDAGAGMDVTGAAVGQIAKITAVDDTGKPTAWEAVDMPSGSGGIGKQSLIPYGSRTSLAQRLTILRQGFSHAQKVNSIILHWTRNMYFSSNAQKKVLHITQS